MSDTRLKAQDLIQMPLDEEEKLRQSVALMEKLSTREREEPSVLDRAYCDFHTVCEVEDKAFAELQEAVAVLGHARRMRNERTQSLVAALICEGFIKTDDEDGKQTLKLPGHLRNTMWESIVRLLRPRPRP